MKEAVWSSDFCSDQLGLIVWLHESISWRNPSGRSASSPKVKEKALQFSPHIRHPGMALINQVGIRNLYHSANIYIKSWNRKQLALERPLILLNIASNITHSSIADQDSSRVATTTSAHCTGHCTVEDFYVKFADRDAKSAGYRTVLWAWRHMYSAGVHRPGTACGPECTPLHV